MSIKSKTRTCIVEKFGMQKLQNPVCVRTDGCVFEIINGEYIEVSYFDFGGYKAFRPTQSGGRAIKVHSLVASCFMKKRTSGKLEINHINCDTWDARLSNLEYCTSKYNSLYSALFGERGQNYRPSNTKSIDVYLNDKLIMTLPSVTKAAVFLGVPAQSVSRTAKKFGVINSNRPNCKQIQYKMKHSDNPPITLADGLIDRIAYFSTEDLFVLAPNTNTRNEAIIYILEVLNKRFANQCETKISEQIPF